MIQPIDFHWRDVPFPYRCDGCPYPRVGFSCRDRDGNCTRTDVEKLTERQRKARESQMAQKEYVRYRHHISGNALRVNGISFRFSERFAVNKSGNQERIELYESVSNGDKKSSLFEKTLADLGIRHKLIRPFTPRHNGKVERSHRKDNEEFYASHKFFSFDDFKKQLALRQRQYNDFPIRPLNWRSPKQVLSSFPNL